MNREQRRRRATALFLAPAALVVLGSTVAGYANAPQLSGILDNIFILLFLLALPLAWRFMDELERRNLAGAAALALVALLGVLALRNLGQAWLALPDLNPTSLLKFGFYAWLACSLALSYRFRP